MSQTPISSFAKQAHIDIDKLLGMLSKAGIAGKGKDDLLDETETDKLTQFIQGGARDGRPQITLKRRTTNQIKQTSRTGAARTVQVEVKKQRTFVKRSVIQARQVEDAKVEVERARRVALVEEERLAQENARVEAEAAADAAVAAVTATTDDAAQAADAEAVEADAPSAKVDTDTPAAKSDLPAAIIPESRPPKVAAKPELAPLPPAREEHERDKKKPKKGKVSKGKSGRREELHARKGRGKTRLNAGHKHRKIVSGIADAHGFAMPTAPLVHEVAIAETVSVSDLAQAMSVKAGEVIKALMSMGSMVTINQLLDRDTAMLVVEEMGHTPKAVTEQDPESLLAHDLADAELKPRPPVVTVMGHVDHGKTSLLDYLRDSKVAASEAGGITQRIGAYKVRLAQGEICFLDTPGHEAFSAMRVRGARATDIVILVVAADDGVKPQTLEAISHARAAEVPMVVAINKIDREEADPEKVRQELANHGVIGEAWGGETLINEVSALSGQGVPELLDAVLLQAEVLDLKARDSGPAGGQVVEARLDKGRGPVATVLVRHGSLKRGDIVLAGRESGRVRVLTDDAGHAVSHAGPSTPVEIQGLAGVPVAGDDLVVVADERTAREVADSRQSKHKESKLARQQRGREHLLRSMGDDSQSLTLLVKADVQGAVEALTDALEKLSIDDIQVKVVHGMVGGINESDVHLAVASNAMIIGFNVRADATARRLIDSEGLAVHYHNVIYDVTDLVKASMTGMLSPLLKEERLGLAEVRDVFKAPKIGAVAGSYVLEGAIRRSMKVRVLRDNIVIFEGAIDSLRRFKDDVPEVKNGLECGIGIKNYNDIKTGDQIEAFEIVETSRQL